MERKKLYRWAGAWPEEVVFSFRRLTSEESIAATEADIGSLGSHPPESARRKRIAALLDQVRGHEGYARLKKHPEFRNVMKERQRLAKRNALFADALGEIRLVHEMALVGLFYPKFEPQRATLPHQRKARTATRALRNLLIPGAQPTDVFEMGDLRRLLGGLEQQLEAQIKAAERSRSRSARADKDAAQRFWVVRFAQQLIESFGEAPSIIVQQVAGMIGYTPDDSTVARYIKRAGNDVKRRARADDRCR